MNESAGNGPVWENEQAERISRALERDYRRYPHPILEEDLA